MEPEASLAVIKNWRRKAFEHSSESNDALLSLFAKGFETIAVFACPVSDSESILRSIYSLENERTIALKYEKNGSNILRHFAFGFIEVFILLMKIQRGNISQNTKQSEEALALIRNWRRKSFELSGGSNDQLLLLFAKVFDTIAIIASPTSNNVSILRSIETLESERTITLEYESGSFDALRFLSFGFIKTFILLMQIQIKKSNSEEQTTVVNSMNDQIPLKIKNEPIDDLDLDYGTFDLYSPFSIKKEEPVEAVSLATFYAMDSTSNEEMQENNKIENMSFTGDISVYKEKNINNPTLKESSGTIVMERRKSSRSVCKPMKYIDFPENSEITQKKSKRDNTMSNGQEINPNSIINVPRVRIINKTELECPECKYYSRSLNSFAKHLTNIHSTTPARAGLAFLCDCGNESQTDYHVRKCDIANVIIIRKKDAPSGLSDDSDDSDSKRKLHKQDMNWDVSNETPKGTHRNDTDLKCPECEYRSKSVASWMVHMRSVHSTDPYRAGVALRCKCGEEVLSAYHSNKCKISSFTVIRKRDGPIKRLEDGKMTPKCVQSLCKTYPRTASTYESHMRLVHKSTLSENNIYLKCSCGTEVRNSDKIMHGKECDPRQFTLHKVEEE